MTLPNVYWTLDSPFVTIVGMYTNVPEHGSIDSEQQQWLTHELADRPGGQGPHRGHAPPDLLLRRSPQRQPAHG